MAWAIFGVARIFVTALSERAADAAVLIITGSPSAHALGGLPKNADYVKIPTLAQTGDVEARPPHLPIDVEELSSVRERLVCETLESFRPDVFLVDTHPLGTRRELRRALQGLRDQPTQVILGLRDIVDEPEAVPGELGPRRCLRSAGEPLRPHPGIWAAERARDRRGLRPIVGGRRQDALLRLRRGRAAYRGRRRPADPRAGARTPTSCRNCWRRR